MTESKSLARLEMFSDGVFAIAITLLILEIKVPPVHTIHSNQGIDRCIDSSLAFLVCFPLFFRRHPDPVDIAPQWI
jgi:uncharacterized membrane protein